MAGSYPYTYIGLVNRVLEDFNEVQLDNSNFASVTGFQSYVKNWVNDALNDIYMWQDEVWPFLWIQKTFNTVIGTGTYSYDASVIAVNWDSFNIIRPSLSVDSITSSGTTATVTMSAGHTLIAGRNDNAIIQGATPSGYNGTWTPTIVSPTVFTYQISSALSSPATGTITMIPPYNNFYLGLKNYDEYLRNWRDVDVNIIQQQTAQPSPPRFIVRKPDNNFIISPYPDRIYKIGYDAFINPDSSALVAASDVPLMPSVFRQVIIDRVGVYCLAFRDNDTQLLRDDEKFKDNCTRMRRVLIPQAEFMNSKN